MPKAKQSSKSTAQKKDPQQELVEIMQQGFQDINDKVNNISKRVDGLEQEPQEQPREKVAEGYGSGYLPPGYREAADQILGKEFDAKVETVEDQDMVTVVVPDSYMPQNQIDAHKSHFKSRRTEYEREIDRIHPNITKAQKDQMMAEYDKKNPDPILPQDKRSRAMSTLKTAGDFRKWLLLIRDNIKKTLEVANKEEEMPTESLSDELNK